MLPPEQQVNTRTRNFFVLALCTLLLAACDPLGLDNSARIAATREAEGKAIGGACRHSGRALEGCYGMNPKTSKAAIFAGWRDMDAYMRENSIQIVAPELPVQQPAGEEPKAGEEEATKNTAAPPAAQPAMQRPDEPASGKRPNRVI